MKICFFCDSVYSYGGVQRVLAVIAKELCKTCDVTIMTMDKNGAHEDVYGLDKTKVKIIYFHFHQLGKLSCYTHKPYSWLYKQCLPKNRLTSAIYAHSSFPAPMRNQLIQALNVYHFDVIVGVHAFLSIRLATIRKKLNASKVIGWMHNSYQAFFENQPMYLPNLKEHFMYQMKKLDDIVVLTHTDAKLYKETFGLEPTVIYNPLTLVPGKRCDITSKTFLAVGRMSPLHKGFDILIKAFSKFAQQDNEWKLNIVGDGPDKVNLIKLIKDNGMTERITLIPFTNNIQQYYSSASIFILSSRWEGFPLVIMEALSHGLPTITSDIPICKEFLKDSSFNTYFTTGDTDSLANAMLHLSKNTDLKTLSNQSLSFSQTNNNTSSIIAQWQKSFN